MAMSYTGGNLTEPAAHTNRSGPDDELLRRVQGGDLAAFEVFYARHATPIYRTAYALTGDRHLAEEVLQDTFFRAYQRRATLRLGVSSLPWLHRVALNLCYSRLDRRRLRTGPIEGSALQLRDGDAEPPERAEQRELAEIVRDGIAALPPKHRSVVVLYYLHGLSLQETASTLDVRLGTVKSRLHYALRSLRDHLERDNRLERNYRPVGRKEELEVPPA